ncbi:OadG family protein [Microbulbifer hainanensis]|uniref:OadG family protein n=1 Tax=Microbulbifer hainanensis TaxID=2735675 RepID=UPI0018665853|nr:OadG family protein [Microbulbifer hainanensis]
MQDTLLQQGMDITVFGMGIVFSFLMALVIATGIMSRIILRNFPEATTPSSGSQTPDDVRLRAIIKAAIQQHRNRNQK